MSEFPGVSFWHSGWPEVCLVALGGAAIGLAILLLIRARGGK